MATSLGAIEDLGDQKAKIEQYKQSLLAIIEQKDESEIMAFIDHMLSDAVGLVVSRQLLQLFAQQLPSLPATTQKPVAQHALEKIQPRAVSYEEQATAIREQLAQLLVEEEDFTKAAQTLAGIDLDSGMRVLDNEYKLRQNIRIAMFYLEDDDSVNAELYIKKASSLIASCKNEELELQYKTSYARILDSKRKFLEASQRYYELSQIGNRDINGLKMNVDELEEALNAAVVCCILAAAGPQRSRVLANLYKDERLSQMHVFGFLEKVFFERILQADEVETFSQGLKEHQKAVTGDGTTVLQKAVIEHNLQAASRLYNNIYFTELGQLLGVSEEKAERIASRMIAEKRLVGCIDQVDSLIYFDTDSKELQQWDNQIQSVCTQLNQIMDTFTARTSVPAG